MRKFLACILLLCALLTLPNFASAETFNVDAAHSSVLYRAGHMGVSNSWGRFNDIAGTVTLDDADPKANKLDITIKSASIDSGNAKRDEHLRNADFLNAKQFPTITFKTDSVKVVDPKTFEATGTLTLHGVSKPLTVKIEKIGSGKNAVGLESTFTIKRTDFDMKNMLEGIPDNIQLIVSIEASHK